jgi:high-affinity Fe2+/Pb2+ permease
MPDMTGLTAVLAATSKDQGPGALLRIVIVVGVVGSVLLAWFLLRGYKQD